MAGQARLATNVPGPLYVNTACINCDQCRQLAPGIFAEVGGYSAVRQQPGTSDETSASYRALLACPTGAIATETKDASALQEAMEEFPLFLTDTIYYCGFTSRNSYGASSYLVVHPDGNWLIDSPRWTPQLVRRIEQMGGIRTIFLTHRDDVADAAKYAERFGAERIIHRLESHAQPDAEHIIEEREPIDWLPGFRIIPTPGHTRGHMVLLYAGNYLFTGDHLAWDRETGELEAFRDVCWFDWQEQTRSMAELAKESFGWVLPGHGDRVSLPREAMGEAMDRLVERMRRQR